ncbi:MAG: hypothetical protein KC912_25860, partial [Proteobacteria bacterium]|nr:hypothetical protein [Pseudomonadota bacterium]
MGVEYTWLATDRADCVYVFWSDKLGAHPDTPCLEEAEPDEFDILHRLLDLEEEGCALYYAHPNESEPACYQRTGGRGDLKASDLPDTWARAARRIALPFDQAPDEIRITDHVEAVRDSDGMTEAETEAYFASRSLSWRIAMD